MVMLRELLALCEQSNDEMLRTKLAVTCLLGSLVCTGFVYADPEYADPVYADPMMTKNKPCDLYEYPSHVAVARRCNRLSVDR